jgi:hypothetical protein
MAAGPQAEGERAPAIVRIALASAIAVIVLNAFTGNPILALWIASKTNGEGPMKMESIGVFLVAMAIISVLLYQLLKAVGAAYDRATGAPPAVRKHLPWNQSLRGDRPEGYGEPPRLSVPERIVCTIVVVAFAAFEYWFFFASCSPIDNRCGRDGVVLPAFHLLGSLF